MTVTDAPATPAPEAGNLLSSLPAAPAAVPPAGMPAVAAPGADWRASLREEYRSNPTLATIKDPDGLAQAYLDTKALVGKKLSPPGEGADPKEVTAWRKLVGAPETPEAYGSLMPEGFQKELWNEGLEKEATALAHKHHMSPAALKEFAALQAKGTQAIYEKEVAAAKENLEKGRAELRTAWGDNFDRRAGEAQAVAAALGIDASDSIFTERPDLLQKLAAAAPAFLGGDKIVNGVPMSVSGGIQDRINTLRDGADYQGRNGPERQEAAASQMRSLYAAMKPAKAT